MRSYCLYNGKYIDIAEIYEVRDGKQINIPEKLKYYRKLSDNRELFCPCGCGQVVVLVAGDRNLRRQHFRLLHNFGNLCCEYQEESELSVKSKIMLKCWLNKNLPVMEHGIKYRVPISQLVENKRRFELSMYSEDYDIGIIYNKYLSNILEEKVDLLSEYMKSKIIYVTRAENEETGGQYPEHMMRVQEAQGYCFYLDMTVKSLYEEVVAKVSIYEKTYKGLWKKINVCQGKLDDFKLRADGSIVYQGESIFSLVDKCKNCFQDEQEFELEQIRKQKEAERLRRERNSQEQEEKRMQRELVEQKAREEKQCKEAEEYEHFLNKYNKIKRIYNLLEDIKIIRSVFTLQQWNEKSNNINIEIEIDELKINKNMHCIEISNNSGGMVYIFVLESDFCKIENKLGCGIPYKVLDYTRIDNVENYFKTAFICVFKEGHSGVECSVPEMDCSHLRENNKCSLETSCKYQIR